MLCVAGGHTLLLRHEFRYTEQTDHMELHVSQNRPRALSQYMLQRDLDQDQSYLADIQPRYEENQETLLYVTEEPSSNRYR